MTREFTPQSETKTEVTGLDLERASMPERSLLHRLIDNKVTARIALVLGALGGSALTPACSNGSPPVQNLAEMQGSIAGIDEGMPNAVGFVSFPVVDDNFAGTLDGTQVQWTDPNTLEPESVVLNPDTDSFPVAFTKGVWSFGARAYYPDEHRWVEDTLEFTAPAQERWAIVSSTALTEGTTVEFGDAYGHLVGFTVSLAQRDPASGLYNIIQQWEDTGTGVVTLTSLPSDLEGQYTLLIKGMNGKYAPPVEVEIKKPELFVDWKNNLQPVVGKPVSLAIESTLSYDYGEFVFWEALDTSTAVSIPSDREWVPDKPGLYLFQARIWRGGDILAETEPRLVVVAEEALEPPAN